MLRPCRGHVPGRIVACGRPCRRPGRPCRSLYHDTPSTKVKRACCVAHCCACRSPPALCRRVLSAISFPLAALYRNTRSPASQPRYNCCIVTQLLAARTACRIAGRLAVSWPSNGRVVACCAVSWHAPARCLPAMPVTIQCIVS